jgi:HAMP domain-containing protein
MPISQILGAIGAPISAGINMIAQNQANKANSRLANQMFDKTNAYNTPLKQVERMKDAGLNPAMMYQGTPQNTATMPQTPRQEAYKIPENLMADVAQKLATAKQAENNTDLIAEKVKTQLLETENARLKGGNIQADTDQKKQLTEQSIQYTNKLVNEGAIANTKFNLDKTLFETNLQYRKTELQKLDLSVASMRQQIEAFPNMNGAKLRQIEQSILTNVAQNGKLNAETWILENDKELRDLGINPNGSNMIDTLLRFAATLGLKATGTEKTTIKNK